MSCYQRGSLLAPYFGKVGMGPVFISSLPTGKVFFETVVGAGPSAVMAPSVEVVSTEIVPIGKSIMT